MGVLLQERNAAEDGLAGGFPLRRGFDNLPSKDAKGRPKHCGNREVEEPRLPSRRVLLGQRLEPDGEVCGLDKGPREVAIPVPGVAFPFHHTPGAAGLAQG